MSLNAIKRTVLILVASCSFGAAKADVFTSGCTLQVNQACTLAELVSDPTAYLQIDGVRFLNFAQREVPFEIASRISVSAIDGPGGADQRGSAVGLAYAPIDGLPSLLEEFSTPTFEEFLEISYDVEVVSGLAIGASSIRFRIGDVAFNPGSELLRGLMSTFIARPGLAGTGMIADCVERPGSPGACAGRQVADSAAFGPSRSLSVLDALHIVNRAVDNGPIFVGSGMQILDASHTFFRLPEPGGLALLGIGFAALAASRRRNGAASHVCNGGHDSCG